jgi:hypothetical protein
MSTAARRSFITPALRPYVQGSSAELERAARSEDSEPTEANSAILVICACDDGTGHYFAEFARAQGCTVTVWTVEHLASEHRYSWGRGRSHAAGAGVFYRGASTEQPELQRLLTVLTDTLAVHPRPVVNRPNLASLNWSKPFQAVGMRAACPAGAVRIVPTRLALRTPPPADAADHVVKSISGVRSLVVSASDERLDRRTHALECPLQIQPRLEGTNVRVHVFDDRLVAARVTTKVIDYRYDDELAIEPIDLPRSVGEWCVGSARAEGLRLAGIDLFQEAASGAWYCFEINPTPAYQFFERHLVEAGREPDVSQWLLEALMSRVQPDGRRS